MTNIRKIAKVIRSKNCSPFELTLDILLKERMVYEKLKQSGELTKEKIAGLYRVPVSSVKKLIWFDPACAVKITMARQVPSGSPGDSDVYGAQQHAPLLDLEFEV